MKRFRTRCHALRTTLRIPEEHTQCRRPLEFRQPERVEVNPFHLFDVYSGQTAASGGRLEWDQKMPFTPKIQFETYLFSALEEARPVCAYPRRLRWKNRWRRRDIPDVDKRMGRAPR